MSTREEVMKSTDYEPYDHRVRPGQTNRVETLVNLIKGILGTGILAMPGGYKNSGFVIGTVGNVVITMIITYCLHLLFKSMYFICKRDKIPIITYPQAFKQGLLMGPKCLRGCADYAPFAVNFFIIIYQLGVMCVYLIFCARNLKQVVDQHTDKKHHFSETTYMIWLLLPILLLCYLKNLKSLAIPSNIANWLTLVGLICIYYFTCSDLGSITERDFFVDVQLMPLFMGTAMFAVLSIGVILSLELNMKNGRYFLGYFGVLNQGMFIVTILNVFTGFMGYWKYGAETKGSVTLNIDITHPVAQAVRILFVLALYVSFALQTYPITEILWEQYIFPYLQTSQHQLMWDYILRTILVLFSFILAVAIPRLGLFISLFGAFCLSILGVIFPPFLDMCTHWPNDWGKYKCILVRDILLIIFGFTGWVFGTYTSLKAIIDSLIKKTDNGE